MLHYRLFITKHPFMQLISSQLRKREKMFYFLITAISKGGFLLEIILIAREWGKVNNKYILNHFLKRVKPCIRIRNKRITLMHVFDHQKTYAITALKVF